MSERQERLLSTGEAARALGLGARSLSRWVNEGKITPSLVTPGGHFRFELDDLRAQIMALAKADKRQGDDE